MLFNLSKISVSSSVRCTSTDFPIPLPVFEKAKSLHNQHGKQLLTSLSSVRNIWLITLSKKTVMASHCTKEGEKMEQRPLSPVAAVGKQCFKTHTLTHPPQHCRTTEDTDNGALEPTWPSQTGKRKGTKRRKKSLSCLHRLQ